MRWSTTMLVIVGAFAFGVTFSRIAFPTPPNGGNDYVSSKSGVQGGSDSSKGGVPPPSPPPTPPPFQPPIPSQPHGDAHGDALPTLNDPPPPLPNQQLAANDADAHYFDEEEEGPARLSEGPRCIKQVCRKTALVRGRNAQAMLVDEGTWKLVTRKAEATLLWLRSNRGYVRGFDSESQICNKLVYNSAVADKALLYSNVAEYEKSNGLSHFSALPFTLTLVTPEDCDRLRDEAVKGSRPGLWIVKMTSQSMGKGIEIVEDLQKWVGSEKFTKVKSSVATGERYVVQKYITNPLLLDGRKSELRLYWVIISVDPLIVAAFHEGQIRLNSMKYQNHSFSNSMIHLTNSFQQREHPDYEKLMSTGQLKWTMAQWKSHLVGRGIEEQQVDRAMRMMRWALVRVANATVSKLRAPEGQRLSRTELNGRFEMFGADFIVDDTMRVRLTEVQQGPGLSHDDPVKARIIGQAVNSVVEYAYNMLTLRRQNLPLTNLVPPSGYEVIINEAVDPPYYYHP